MQYMMMFYETEAECARRDHPGEAPAYYGAWNAYIGALAASGIVRSGNGLQAPRTSTTVRLEGGQRQIHDGPYADTREHLGGYFIVEVGSLEEALEWAARSPNASAGHTELRPVMLPPAGATVA